MRYVLLLGTLLLFLTGCSDTLTVESDTENPSGELTFVNAADRPFAVIVFNEEDAPLIDPLPALSAVDFEARKINVGASARTADTGYESGKGAFVLIYAPCNCELSEQIVNIAGPDAAPIAKIFTLSVETLRLWDYRVVIEEL